MTDNDLSIERLRWQCRRGMLELDFLLERFLNQRYAQLSAEQQKNFVTLLSYTDPELFSWLTGASQPEDKNLQWLVTEIRKPI